MFSPWRPSSTLELKYLQDRGGLNGHGFDEIKEDIIRGGEWRHAGVNSTKLVDSVNWDRLTLFGTKLKIGKWGLVKSGRSIRGVHTGESRSMGWVVLWIWIASSILLLQYLRLCGLDFCWVPVNGVLVHTCGSELQFHSAHHHSIFHQPLLHCSLGFTNALHDTIMAAAGYLVDDIFLLHWDLLFHLYQHVLHCFLWLGNHLYTKRSTDFL